MHLHHFILITSRPKKTNFEIYKNLYLYVEKAGAGHSDLFTTTSVNEV
jgi:hypothetical protein